MPMRAKALAGRFLFATLMMLAARPSVARAQQPAVATNGILAYYPFAGDTTDRSGNGFDGAATNVVWATNRFGTPNGALWFNGTGSLVDLGNPAAFNFAGDFSLSVWLRAVTPQPAEYLIGKYYAYTDVGYGIGTGPQSQAYSLFQLHGFPSGVYLQSATSIADGGWHQIISVCERTNEESLYLDGTLVVSSASIRGIVGALTNVSHLLIGQLSSGEGFHGFLDDVRVYNRALSAEDAAQLFAYENAFDYTPPTLAAGLTNAVAVASLNGGSVSSIEVTGGGAGYLIAPKVSLLGGGGTGAAAIAIVQNGAVVQILLTNTGFGYTNAPTVFIETPASPPSVNATVDTIRLTSSVTPGKNYILESTTNLTFWTPIGTNFTPVRSTITNIVPVQTPYTLYRIRQLPTP